MEEPLPGRGSLGIWLREPDMETSATLRTDHRGSPEAPGRVVTVIERSFWESLSDPQQDLERTTDGSLVWGAAYHIPASHAEEVSAYLDDREIDGYSVHYTPFYPCSSFKNDEAQPAAGSQPRKCLVYIGLPSNTQFVREPTLREPDAIAEVIYASRGLSGENKDYLYSLETALEGLGLGSSDVHVTDLVRRVKALERRG
ncbi:cation transporter ChaC [Trichophyton rubrum]|uniref:glutathione-specific gamma-glutamylcyclotransferase n=1 Tax=Trichophyton rubrum TaxID=5551 RepID=A0A178F5Z4_TRIRU|nr:cation transporter ChaC [Trichophyton rubrum]